jgi:hypothetical protein
MSNREEQLMELEAMESLFPEEFRRDPSDTKFSFVKILPYSDHSQENYVSVSVDFTFPPGYPSEEPIGFTITAMTGAISTDSSKLDELNGVIDSEIAANFGMAGVYQVIEKIIEWLRENNEEERSLFDQLTTTVRVGGEDEYDDSDDSDWSGEDDSDESEDDGEYQGLQSKNLCPESARVSDSQFASWRVGYEDWLMENGFIKRSSDTRPTGKEQFLTNLANRSAGKPKLDGIDESLFDDDALMDALELEEEE